jgi:hypothetical protein
MKDVKYVIVDGSAIVFSAVITHSEMVKYNKKAEGAGFVRFYPSKNEWGEDVIIAKCYGESISLGVESRGQEDSLIVTSQICGKL